MRLCEFCSKKFQPKEKKTRFCSRSCASRQIHNRPEIKERWVQSLRAHPEWRQRAILANANRPPGLRAVTGRKISASHKASGYKPKIRGGNGTGPTKAEIRLMEMVPDLSWNVTIKTGKWNGSGFPPVYKVDTAIPAIKLAIEADGGSHCPYARQAQDRKKEDFLKALGWTVLRFSNRQILDVRLAVGVVADIEFTISRLRSTQATA